jgi:hypothetical protein
VQAYVSGYVCVYEDVHVHVYAMFVKVLLDSLWKKTQGPDDTNCLQGGNCEAGDKGRKETCFSS